MASTTYRSINYYTYIESPDWRERARLVADRDGNRCQDCGRRGILNVHHLTYARLCDELHTDLITVCWDCHESRHLNHWRTSPGGGWDSLGTQTAWRRSHWQGERLDMTPNDIPYAMGLLTIREQ